jgi:RNA polymerase nonessential primary-like sigma factor
VSDPELHRRAREGDIEARNQIVTENMGLAVAMSRPYFPRFPRIEREVIVSFAATGLMDAAARYDPDRGRKFSTYAKPWVRRAVTQGLAKEVAWFGEPIMFFTGINGYLRLLKRERNGRGGSGKTIPDLLAHLERDLERGHTFDDRPGRNDRRQSDARLEVSELRWDRLTPWERLAIEAHFGLGGREEANLVEIGDQIGRTRERARQLLVSGISKLRGGAA